MISQSLAEEARSKGLTLVIPSTGGATDIQKFVTEVKDKFRARIMKVKGSPKETLVTLKMEHKLSPNILDEIGNMPKVVAAEETKLPKTRTALHTGILVTLGAGSDQIE